MTSRLRFFFTVALDMAHASGKVALLPFSRAVNLDPMDAEVLLGSMAYRGLLEPAPDTRRENPVFILTHHGRNVRKSMPKRDFTVFCRDCRLYS